MIQSETSKNLLQSIAETHGTSETKKEVKDKPRRRRPRVRGKRGGKGRRSSSTTDTQPPTQSGSNTNSGSSTVLTKRSKDGKPVDGKNGGEDAVRARKKQRVSTGLAVDTDASGTAKTPKPHRKSLKKVHVEAVEKKEDKKEGKGLILGINAVTKALERSSPSAKEGELPGASVQNDTIALVLVARGSKAPPVLTAHLRALAWTRGVPLLALPANQAGGIQEAVPGMKSLAALALPISPLWSPIVSSALQILSDLSDESRVIGWLPYAGTVPAVDPAYMPSRAVKRALDPPPQKPKTSKKS